MRQNPFARLLAYILNNHSIGGVLDNCTVNDLTANLVPISVLRSMRSTPTPTSRPSVTIGKRQMSQKSRANRRKASAKARRR